MKTLSISTEDEEFNATIEALCHSGNYQSGDKVEFAQQVLLEFLGRCRKDLAMQQVRQELDKQAQIYHEQIEEANSKAKDTVQFTIT